MTRTFKKYLRHTAGAVAVAFGLSIPVLVSAVGVSIDIAQAYLVQERLSHALDAAALAAAATASDDPAVIEQKVLDFIDVNYPEDKIGATTSVNVEILDNEISVYATARLNTAFMRLVGIETVDVDARSVVEREVRGIEVVLVLDNTGSMANNDNIDTLKAATTDFINIMFDEAQDPEHIKIGLVPYSNSVRVGRYGLGLNPDGTVYGDGTPFVTLPPGVTYTTTHDSTNWYGCVVEHKESGYESGATHVANSKGQLWRDASNNWDGHGWNAGSSTNDPYPYDNLDNYSGPWDIYAYGKRIGNGSKCTGTGYSSSRCTSCNGDENACNATHCYCWMSSSNGGINSGCPYAMVQPLTSDRDELLEQVEETDANDMIPHGNTLGNIGMVWGYRLISPEAPFSEGAEWNDNFWRKVVILMTDGDNTDDATYSSYWFAARNSMNVTKFNTRLEETCDAIKAEDENALIYTVTFTSGINDTTKGYYRRCASDENKYYDAPSKDDLRAAFEQIARELSNLRIKE